MRCSNVGKFEICDEAVLAFIGQRSGEALKLRHNRGNIVGRAMSKIEYIALPQNLTKRGTNNLYSYLLL